VKPSGRALLGLPSALSLELVEVGMGASRTDEGRELATADMLAAGAVVVVGVLLEEPLGEPLEELSEDSSSSESSSELSEVSMGVED
jgi:hypothetical protein